MTHSCEAIERDQQLETEVLVTQAPASAGMVVRQSLPVATSGDVLQEENLSRLVLQPEFVMLGNWRFGDLDRRG